MVCSSLNINDGNTSEQQPFAKVPVRPPAPLALTHGEWAVPAPNACWTGKSPSG